MLKMSVLREKGDFYNDAQNHENLTQAGLIESMQSIAPPGQDELDEHTLSQLRDLTQELINVDRAAVVAEHDYYIGTEARQLTLPHDKVLEHIQGKTILVSGGTGLIGSTLLAELSRFNPGRLVSISRGEMLPYKHVPGVEYSYGDVRDSHRMFEVMGDIRPDIVYHVAADKYNHEAESRAQHTLSTNIIGTQNMLDAASKSGVKNFIYASTGKATRPLSPDIYASSKKTGEWLVSKQAEQGGMLCSAGRFTHVVDGSSLIRKINHWIEKEDPVRIHKPSTMFYIQSAKESAQLLINSGLEAESGVLRIQAIRNLQKPVCLHKLAAGAIAKSSADVPIYFQGLQEGYEDEAWRGLYHPLTAVDNSPLVSSLEADDVMVSSTCSDVDVFPLSINSTAELSQSFAEFEEELIKEDDDPESIRIASHRHSAAMLDARLDALPHLSAGKNTETY